MKNRQSIRRGVGVVCASLMLLVPAGTRLVAQENPDQQAAPSEQQLLSPDQLNTLVAPIALYPDKLLSQVLVASTYPLEIVELGQWLQQNGSLQGAQRVDAARQQNWDPSIQALVAFPDVVGRLNSDIRWTTDLGNAFLAQEADVMNAVQRMRAQASASGKLNSTPQQSVTTETQNGETVYDIQPTDPEVVYVPVYNPQYIWGPPAYGYYPPLYYPNYGFGFGSGIYIGSFFGGLGWGGWGWGPNWFGGVVITNGYFFNHYGFHNYYGGRFAGGFRGGVWSHNPEHRMGVAYSNRGLANRFGGNFAGRNGAAGFARSQPNRVNNGGNFGNRGNLGAGQNYRSQEGARSFGSQGNRMDGSANRQNEQRGFSSNGRSSFSTPESRGGGNQNYRSNPSFNNGSANGFRSAPSNGGASNNGGFRSAPSYRSSPPAGGGNSFRSAPSTGGGYRGGGGGSVHSSGGGGGSHGGGSHGGHR